MDSSLILRFITLSLLHTLSVADPKPKAKPQFFPLFPGAPPPPHHHFLPLGGHEWRRSSQSSAAQNLTSPGGNPSHIDPLSVGGEDFLKNDIPRQIYGLPPPSSHGGYPQIYRIDNLIIIANPVQNRPQPCIPQQPSPSGDSLDNRFGSNNNDQSPEPGPCTWAIVACCSPGSENIRYSCFELFQCLGAFVGRSPCNRVVVEEAAKSALAYYSRTNSSNAGTGFNQL